MIYKFIDDNGAEITINSLSQLQILVEDKTIKKSTKLKVGLRGKWGKAKDVKELKFEEEKEKKKEEAEKVFEDIESFITSDQTPPLEPTSPLKKETIPKTEKTKIDIKTPIETEEIVSKDYKATDTSEELRKEEINNVKKQTIDSEANKKQNLVLFFKKLWQGKYSLKLSFWGLYLLPNLLFSILLFFLLSNVLKTETPLASVILFYTVTFAVISYIIISMLGTWKSANHFRNYRKNQNKPYGLAIVAQIFVSADILLRIIGAAKQFV